MSDRDLLSALLESVGLSDREAEAFQSMQDWLLSSETRSLSAKQREWASATATARGLLVEESKNLFSAGLVPIGIPTRKTSGEEKAAKILAARPLSPPGRAQR